MSSVGDRIRYYRKKCSLTLQELAFRTSLSVGYLSNLERNITSPSIDNLKKVCEAMAVSIVDVIYESIQFQPVIRCDDRKLVYSKDYRLKYEFTTDTNQKILGKCQILYSSHKGKECCWGHETDEVGIVVRGSMVIDIYGESYVLNEGDSIYVKALTKHEIRRCSECECISYWFAINPDFDDKTSRDVH